MIFSILSIIFPIIFIIYHFLSTKKIEKIKDKKIREMEERRYWIISYVFAIIITVLVFLAAFEIVEQANKDIIEFCKDKEGIYKFTNCTGRWPCLGREVFINCTEINEIVKKEASKL
jgi:uncharacterized membrane protein